MSRSSISSALPSALPSALTTALPSALTTARRSARPSARRWRPTTLAALLASVVVAAIAATAATALPAIALASGTVHPARASLLDIESDVMCPSCHEPLEAVSSPQALFEKAYIKMLIARGDTKPQILNNLVAQYGVGVLAKPPARGFDLLIYVLPPLALAGGLAFLVFTLPRWRARSRAAAATPLGHAPPVSDADARRIDDDLRRLI